MLRSASETARSEAEGVGKRDVGENQATGWPIKALGALVIGGLGGYKLLAALAKGRHNVLFLILMAIGSLWILLAMSPGLPPEAGE